MRTFYLGTDRLTWLWDGRFAEVPLFVSHHALKRRKSAYPRALAPYGIDSGAFTELARHGRWVTTPEEYVAALRRYWTELGPFAFAGPQDSLCAPALLDVDCKTVDHMRLANALCRFVELAGEGAKRV